MSGFEIIPAIDILGGRCVRLLHGDYERETVYGDPVEMALRWEALGATRLHVVDLDGAREKRPVNQDVVVRLAQAVQVPVEVSGGIRNLETIAMWARSGVARIQLGSVAVADPELVRKAVSSYGDRIVVSIDCRDGEVMTNGWLEGSGRQALELARAMAEAGVSRVMVTDIGRDGALSGPNVELYRSLVRALPIPVVASGGVATYAHLVELAEAGCEGVVVGKALYEGAIELPRALEVIREATPC
jgi:phosphoribosylformimino-5-aminoimidazole carboxamide ribotide isomerase